MRLSIRGEVSIPSRTATVSLLKRPLTRGLRIEDLCFTEFLDRSFLENRGFRLSSEPAIVVPVGWYFFIVDGNHRCAYELLFRKQQTVKCAIWTHNPSNVLVCESRLFKQVIERGPEVAVRAHQSVMGGIDTCRPGRIVFE